MARYAVVDGSNTVVNVIEAEPGFTLEGFTLVQSDAAGPGWTYDGQTLAAPVPSLADVKASKTAAIDAIRDTKLTGGYTVPSAVSTALAGKLLQTRDVDDRTNWLTSQAAYSAQVAAGQGATVNAKFRAADNSSVTVSYEEGLNVLLAMAAWGASIYNNTWSLKDAINAAADQAALDAIDIDAGWPA